jgi:hypothetical protein
MMLPMTPSTVSLVYQANLSDPDIATRETVGLLTKLIHDAAREPAVQHLAETAVSTFKGGPLYSGDARSDPRGCALSCWWYAKQFVKALRHSEFKALVAAYPEKRQLLIPVDSLASIDRADCSVFTELICAMLESLGVKYELVTVAVDREDPMLFSHVYPQATLEDGTRLPLDAHAGPYPGWQVPSSDVFRYQVWDASGSPTSAQRPAPMRLNGYVRQRGMGDGDDASTDLTTNQSLISGGIDWSSFGVQSSGGAATAPSQSSSDWAGFATALAKSGMQLAEINAIQPGTVVSSNGSILRQATGLAVPTGTSSVTATLGSSSSTLLLLGGAALLMMFMFMGKNRS